MSRKAGLNFNKRSRLWEQRRKEDEKHLAWALEDYRERCARAEPDLRIEPDEDGYMDLYIGEPDGTPFDGSVAAGWPTSSSDPDRRAFINQWLAESQRPQAA